ncbi:MULTISPECIES: Fur family transcriptional regulator [Kosmotoga]|uniref:Ferric uptake regulator, Fur family n=1 Tax=Kosmotoga olearia (strain ATCC BAA-1733 / DSM 21960 / TBF 19.5.1) TaxID=521045 RepID=C5CEN8_KOSOT|nr:MULTISPECIES: Fur family transcriptional regulator [Kosmotoga]ACR80218.1 ferric uptake regulator, Fur family [Kosmotoga olearia TBF 19.5.1]MDI3523498.1 Fur family transcriptional regulator, ferric uptake regulator [Kosmotoga sp.]MDK2952960.1 Fur family transcriptional regulator, ferric uptake regulator [Kosmotoga sp.]
MKQDILRSELRKRKQRMTAQRELILKAFMESGEEHMSAEEVYRKVLERRLRISKATVYRTVELLTEVGLLRKIVFRDGVVRYELVDKGEHHHHHLVCNSCGKVIEFPEDLLDGLENLIEEKTGFKITDHQLKFYGLCSECQKSIANKE